ncbi:MAG: hypothetical protein IH904_05390 [Proteobacteria bacterium]|nr:hypothetical protein [Pseudomonadota bacterium]
MNKVHVILAVKLLCCAAIMLSVAGAGGLVARLVESPVAWLTAAGLISASGAFIWVCRPSRRRPRADARLRANRPAGEEHAGDPPGRYSPTVSSPTDP